MIEKWGKNCANKLKNGVKKRNKEVEKKKLGYKNKKSCKKWGTKFLSKQLKKKGKKKVG